MSNFKSTLMASVGAAAMLLAPLAMLPATSVPAGYAALAEKGGNGKGGGSDNGNGNGNGNGGGGGSESHGNSGNTEKHEEKAAAREEAKADKTKNLNSQLGRLNSLKRNVNGLMNSSDPHMAGIRDYVRANAALDEAEAALAIAQGNYDTALGDYNTLVGGTTFGGYDGYVYPDTSLATLEGRLETLEGAPITDPADPLYAAYTAEVTSLQAVLESEQALALGTATTELADAEDDVTEATAGTTDADLQAALADAANKDGDITPEMLAWAKAQLGID
jgi:hypothetical protein